MPIPYHSYTSCLYDCKAEFQAPVAEPKVTNINSSLSPRIKFSFIASDSVMYVL